MTDPIERMYDKAFAPPTSACIIVYGNIADGFDFMGPFDDHDAALAYTESVGWSDGWHIVALVPPEPTDNADDLRDHICERDERSAQFDGHGIFLAYTCDKCHAAKMAKFRDDIFTPYEADEPIEEI